MIVERGHLLERRVGIVLAAATLAGTALLGLGVAAMLLAGRPPLAEHYPAFDPARLGPDLVALSPEGLLWLGLVAVILTPVLRVAASLVGFARSSDPRPALVALAVLVVLLLSVILGSVL